MARPAKSKCPCGCGQAPAKSCRMRLVRCICGNVARQSRECISRGPLGCPCGDRLEPVCLDDRMHSGDEGIAQSGYETWLEVDHARAVRTKPSQGVRRVFQCHGCRRMLKSPTELCRHCGYQNDPRPGCGGYVEGASACREAMPF